jgi:hypothetical protein
MHISACAKKCVCVCVCVCVCTSTKSVCACAGDVETYAGVGKLQARGRWNVFCTGISVGTMVVGLVPVWAVGAGFGQIP